ncbi:MAG TPA: YwiC-like family protein [Candidatus Kapabacteria bacterium]|nr:YwiC-like family protein [Candidatus Kapabacteria bacterium]
MAKELKSFFPKEHGAYVVLLSAWLFGIVFSHESDNYGFTLSLILSGSLFCLQEPIKDFINGRKKSVSHSVIYVVLFSSLALCSGILLLVKSIGIPQLIVPLIAVVLSFSIATRSRYSVIVKSMIGFIGLSLVTPLTILSAQSASDIVRLLAIWVFVALFFCSSIFCVEIRISKGSKITTAILYHVLTVAITAILISSNLLPIATVAPLCVITIRFVLVLLFQKRYSTIAIKHIGIQESIVALAGVLFTTIFLLQ